MHYSDKPKSKKCGMDLKGYKLYTKYDKDHNKSDKVKSPVEFKDVSTMKQYHKEDNDHSY